MCAVYRHRRMRLPKRFDGYQLPTINYFWPDPTLAHVFRYSPRSKSPACITAHQDTF